MENEEACQLMCNDSKLIVTQVSLTCFYEDFEKLSKHVRKENVAKKIQTEIERLEAKGSILRS